MIRAREKRLGLLKRFLANGLIDGSSSWNRNLAALRRSFGLQPHGALAAAPHRWAHFHEPQITRGLCHFLSEGPAELQRRRVLAVVSAAWGERMPTDFDAATHEVRAEDGRIDLTAILTSTDGRRIGVAIEAKFGHRLTPRQLQRYRRLASTRLQLAPEDRALLVVMPSLDPASRRFLRRNREWRFLSWGRLLVRIDNAMESSMDDEDFRRFRRTIWLRAYQT